jgi:hypothetical protein
MPLTLRTNGSGATNLVTAAWWNDYYNLLTGNMNDQPIQLNNTLALQSSMQAPPTPTLTAFAGSGLGVGNYEYGYSFVNSAGGETWATWGAVTTTSANARVTVGISTGPSPWTVARKLYRTKVGGFAPGYFLRTINDNTTTSFVDSAADSTLPARITGTSQETRMPGISPTYLGEGIDFKFQQAMNFCALTPVE